jgi:hypothetical protein
MTLTMKRSRNKCCVLDKSNFKLSNFLTTPARCATPPRRGIKTYRIAENSPPAEGWQAEPDGVV